MNYRKIFITTIFLIQVMGITAQNKQHPYLFFTPDKIQILKEQIGTDKQYQTAWKEIKDIADQTLKKDNATDKLDYLALVYLVTGDKQYLKKIKESIRKTAGMQSLESRDMLNREPAWQAALPTAHACYNMGLGFDAIYHDITKEERIELARGINKIAIKPAYEDWLSRDKRFHALNSMGHNYWISGISMLGIGAMAVSNELPEASIWIEEAIESTLQWFKFEGDILQNKPRTLDNGGYYEGINYANYALSQYCLFLLALENYMPEKKLHESIDLTIIPDFFMHTSYPATSKKLSSLYFGDGNLYANGQAPVNLLWALGYRNDNMLWYLNQITPGQAREGLSLNTPVGIVYNPDLSTAPSLPELPLTSLYKEMGWATMRTSWEKDATFLGIKCGHTWNHAHADASSFILFHKGEQILKDGGNCWYAHPAYRDYFFQSQAHNIILFDGKAQPQEQQYRGSMLDGSLHHLLDGGNIKYILANATGPTSAYFSRNFRNFLWIDDVILIIDDVKSHEYGTFSMLLHPEGKSYKNGVYLDTENNQSAISFFPIWPDYITETDFEHDFPDNMKIRSHQAPIAKDHLNMETYYSFTFPRKTNQTKFLSAIILKESPDSKDYSTITRLTGDDLQGVRITYKGKVTDVYVNLRADGRIMHRNSTNKINGWDTDAYLLAYSYPEGANPEEPANIRDLFVGYGSYVRKEGEPIFDSYSKLFMIWKKDTPIQQLHMDAQQRIDVLLGFTEKPSELIINGESCFIEYDKNQLRVKRK